MRGRATRVVLPTLVVLGLVAVVAIAVDWIDACVGRTRRDRRPSRCSTRCYTPWNLDSSPSSPAGCSSLYGLTQRKAIAQEVASGRYRRTSLVAWLVFVAIFSAFAYWRLQVGSPGAGASMRSRRSAAGRSSQRPPDQEPSVVYEPSISWIPIAVSSASCSQP